MYGMLWYYIVLYGSSRTNKPIAGSIQNKPIEKFQIPIEFTDTKINSIDDIYLILLKC